MSETLKNTILDQHARVQSAGENGHEVLGDAKEEIMSAATPEEVRDILDITGRHSVYSARRGPDEADSAAHFLRARVGAITDRLFAQNQGYVGLVVPDKRIVVGVHASRAFTPEAIDQIMKGDPIQRACGDEFYPAMMWVKGLYSEAYKNRPESQKKLPIHVWLAELAGIGLFQGSMPVDPDLGLLGATGFMPSESVRAKLNGNSAVAEHMTSEPIEVFRASGLMDQVALRALTTLRELGEARVIETANEILAANGSLN